jgi:hypothetical protein
MMREYAHRRAVWNSTFLSVVKFDQIAQLLDFRSGRFAITNNYGWRKWKLTSICI